ncbi:MAG: SIMPL domain-containing protein [Anaerolineales bacterium]|nr:SIMPL domain-containing protein [Anaerolineales bacterium]
MRNKTLFVSAVMLVALALGACSPTIMADAAPPVRTLNVNGTGQIFLSPDIAYIYIGVHTEEVTAADAVTANNEETQQVIEALKAAGVDAKDIRTTNFSIWPNQQYSPEGQPIGTRYVVDNSVFVTVRKLDDLGDLLDAAVSAGANSINSIQFDVADKTDALKKAREEAVKDAKAQAQELADVAGMSLGEVQSISFYDSAPVPYMDSYGKGGGGAAVSEVAAVPIQPGQLTLTVTVSMSYEIK